MLAILERLGMPGGRAEVKRGSDGIEMGERWACCHEGSGERGIKRDMEAGM